MGTSEVNGNDDLRDVFLRRFRGGRNEVHVICRIRQKEKSAPFLSGAFDLRGHFIWQADDDLAVEMDLSLMDADLVRAGGFCDVHLAIFDDQVV